MDYTSAAKCEVDHTSQIYFQSCQPYKNHQNCESESAMEARAALIAPEIIERNAEIDRGQMARAIGLEVE